MPADRDWRDAQRPSNRRNRRALGLVHHDGRAPAGVELLERAPHGSLRDEFALDIRGLRARRLGFTFWVDAILRRSTAPLVALKIDEHAHQPCLGMLTRSVRYRLRRFGGAKKRLLHEIARVVGGRSQAP